MVWSEAEDNLVIYLSSLAKNHGGGNVESPSAFQSLNLGQLNHQIGQVINLLKAQESILPPRSGHIALPSATPVRVP
jgi:hypothetical protein